MGIYKEIAQLIEMIVTCVGLLPFFTGVILVITLLLPLGEYKITLLFYLRVEYNSLTRRDRVVHYFSIALITNQLFAVIARCFIAHFFIAILN